MDGVALKNVYEFLFENSQDMMCTANAEGYFVELNDCWVQTLGFSKEILRSKPFIEFVHPEDREATIAEAAALRKGKRTIAFENRYLCANGTYKNLHWTAGANLEENFIFGSARDVTAQKLDAVELQRSNRLLDAVELQRSNRLLDAINALQSAFISTTDTTKLFEDCLASILAITGSEYGFIARKLETEDGRPYLKVCAITDISWDDATKRFYEENAPGGLEFYNLNTLFGRVVLTEQVLITNEPAHSPYRGGTPKGHPPLKAFLGAPLCVGDEMVGMVGIANRNEGYDDAIYHFIKPLLATCGHLIAANHNAHHRSQIAKDLLRSETQMRAIFTSAVDTMILTTDSGSIINVNPSTEKLFGYQREELIGEKIDILTYGTNSNLLTQLTANRNGIQNDAVMQLCEGVRKNGQWIFFESAVTALEIEGERQFLCVIRDVTSRKRAEQALQETTMVQQAILNSANFTIISTEIDGTITTFNAGAERMLQYSAKEIVGNVTPELIHDKNEVVARAKVLSEELGEEIQPGFDVFVAKARRGIPDENEWTYIRKDGTTFPVLLSVTGLWNEQGELTGFLGIGRDLTEHKKIDKLKSEFVATVSHELRTPLTSIRGALSLLRGGVVSEADAKSAEVIDIAENNCERLIRLINDILDLEKIEAGEVAVNLTIADISAVVEEAVLANEAYAKEFDVQLCVEDSGKHPAVMADKDRLIQVLTNLLSNAIKFSPESGRVVTSIVSHPPEVMVCVKDEGEGIPLGFQQAIFDKFTQADSSDARKKGGSGLGLNIAKSLIDQHGGRIWFETSEGAGTCFFFTLPVA